MRTPVIAANWKMHMTTAETEAFINEFLPLVKGTTGVEIVVAPPFTSLTTAAALLPRDQVKLAAQDVFYEDKGAFTGEIAPAMLTDIGCTHVIVGHSERRQHFHEDDGIINKKIAAARRQGLEVIFCIGESLDEREQGKTFDVLTREIEEGLKGLYLDGISLAYEPIWAIGTGKTATPEQAQESHAFIRKTLQGLYGSAAQGVRILYGGSVTPDNVDSLMACADVDGALVGGASLKAESFARIVRFRAAR